jgi:ABC-type cobalt transport system substrate-binding protein
MRLDERRIAGGSLVLAAVLFLVANLIHPKEYATGDGNEADQLAEIAEHYTRWQVAHLFTLGTLFALAAGIVALAVVVYTRSPRVGLWGGALGIAGLIGLGGVLALDGFAWGIVGEVSARNGMDRATAEQVLHDLQGSEWSLQFYLLPVAWIIGMIVLALGAWRSRIVPAWAAWAFAVGSLVVGLEGAIHSNAYFIAASVVFLAGAIALAVGLRDAAPAATPPAG